MKTKAYKLAAELGLHEQSILDWLRANGYPNARRADMIRADVAQAARKALGGQSRRRPLPGHSNSPPRVARRHDSFSVEPAPVESNHEVRLTATFAELLDESMGTGGAHMSETIEVAPVRNMEPPASETSRPPVEQAVADMRIQTLLEKLEVEKSKVEGLERLLKQGESATRRAEVAERTLEDMRIEQERLLLERSQVKHEAQTARDEREMLEAACAELRAEVEDLRGAISEYEELQVDHDSVMGDLETARQRETAWRTRALELERAAHSGDQFSDLLREHGLLELNSQVRFLESLLSTERTASAFLKSVRQIDSELLNKVLTRQLVPTCTHPICQQVTLGDDRVPMRVDNDIKCRVCGGDPDRRWFEQMLRECRRSGVRRLLVVGGAEETQLKLRALSEGTHVDLRLLGVEDEPPPARVDSRVEGCDAIIVWSDSIVLAELTQLYVAAAQRHHRLVISVLGGRDGVVPLARATVYHLARTHLFESH